jgi:hypothetical protein
VLNYFFILTAPVFLGAGISTVLSVLIDRLLDRGEDGDGSNGSKGRRRRGYTLLLLPPRVILAVFVSSDVVATLTQVPGAAIVGAKGGKREDPDMSNDILLGGLAWQVFSMGVFVLVLGFFVWRARKRVGESRGLVVVMVAFGTATGLVYLPTDGFSAGGDGAGVAGGLEYP